MEKTQKERMLAGELYLADSPELFEDNQRISTWLTRYNASLAMPPTNVTSCYRKRSAMSAAG